MDAAKLGRADDMVNILNTQYGVFSTYGVFPNLLFNQLDYYSAEGYGTFAAALQDALHQSLSPTPVGDPVIRVFPAWDAKYKLLVKDGFLGSSSRHSSPRERSAGVQDAQGRERRPWSGWARRRRRTGRLR
ncbi:hypothetical protein [Kribbella sp. NPDC049584]|uniref:hypothetical protein n=1 Tax=Kribbella sp. NPDC049584 TaxID=3154833 RepID=UPI00342395CA